MSNAVVSDGCGVDAVSDIDCIGTVWCPYSTGSALQLRGHYSMEHSTRADYAYIAVFCRQVTVNESC